jgi:Ni/Co efflux regulator RcnB
MRKLILAALMGATLVPGAAVAQNRELWRDRQEIREERRDLDRAYRSGDRREIRDERGDLRDARREYREDRRDYVRDYRGRYDWQNHRRYNRDVYRGGNWRSDYRYRSFRPGITLDQGYYQPRYYMNDYSRYRLQNPGWGQRWVRHYNDVLLVDVRSGRVIDVHRNFYW